MLLTGGLSGFLFAYFGLASARSTFSCSCIFKSLGYSGCEVGELVAIPMLMRCWRPSLGLAGERHGPASCYPCVLGALIHRIGVSPAIFYRQDISGWLMINGLHSLLLACGNYRKFEAINPEPYGSQSSPYSMIRLWGSVGFIANCDRPGSGAAIFQSGRLPLW